MKEIERIMRIMNSYTINIPGYSAKQNYGAEKKNVSQNIYLNKNYLLMKNQERNCYSRYTNISGKGLEKRIMNKVHKRIMNDIKTKKEKNIEKAFARKCKSRRWMKRHHQNIYN